MRIDLKSPRRDAARLSLAWVATRALPDAMREAALAGIGLQLFSDYYGKGVVLLHHSPMRSRCLTLPDHAAPRNR